MSGEGDFIAKWRTRWPEWRIGMTFVPAEHRAQVEAWFALLDEFGDAAWTGADPTPGLAKLAWWQEELQGWAKGARRHPLSAVLQRVDAPWHTLALALRSLPAARVPSADIGTDLQALGDLGHAIAACESRLFGGQDATPASASAADAALLAMRAMLHGDADTARSLLSRWPGRAAGVRPRRIANVILAGRMQSLVRTGEVRPVAGMPMLWRAWRAATAR